MAYVTQPSVGPPGKKGRRSYAGETPGRPPNPESGCIPSRPSTLKGRSDSQVQPPGRTDTTENAKTPKPTGSVKKRPRARPGADSKSRSRRRQGVFPKSPERLKVWRVVPSAPWSLDILDRSTRRVGLHFGRQNIQTPQRDGLPLALDTAGFCRHSHLAVNRTKFIALNLPQPPGPGVSTPAPAAGNQPK